MKGLGVAGAATTVILFIVGQLGVDVPGEVAAALTTLLAAGGAWVQNRLDRAAPQKT